MGSKSAKDHHQFAYIPVPEGERAVEDPAPADEGPPIVDEAEIPTEGAEEVAVADEAQEAELPVAADEVAAKEADMPEDHQENQFQDPLDQSPIGRSGGGAAIGALSKGPPPGHSFTGAGAIPGMPFSQWINQVIPF